MRSNKMQTSLKLVAFVAVILLLHSPARVEAASECMTIKDVEQINRGVISRVARFKGKDAEVFVALDPIWSEPEFQYEGYRDKHFIASVKEGREALAAAGIDELVLWKFTGSGAGLGAAVPFANGCAVTGYGEPDLMDKLTLMKKTTRLIAKRGIDDPKVRSSIKELLMASRYAMQYNDEMVDIMIDRLRQFTE